MAGGNRGGRPRGGDFPRNFDGQAAGLPRPPEGQAPSGGFQTGGGFPSGNFGNRMTERLSEAIQSGQMPPAKYTLIHPSARLTEAERQQLLQGLIATFGNPAQ